MKSTRTLSLAVTALLFVGLTVNEAAKSGLGSDGSSQGIRDADNLSNNEDSISIQDYPYTASLSADSIHFGSAAIIDTYWLLSTAGVISIESESNIEIRVGSNLTNEFGRTYKVEKTVIHPNYSSPWTNDVGLIKLNEPLEFDVTVQAIEISSDTPEDGQTAVLSGFGQPGSYETDSTNSEQEDYDSKTSLRAVDLSVMSYDKCKVYFPISYTFTVKSFCTANTRTKRPSSFDFGSALVYQKKLVGTLSTVFQAYDLDIPAVYADVTQAKDWITQTIQNDS